MLSVLGITALFVGFELSSSGDAIDYRRELARADSSARVRYKAAGLRDSLDVRIAAGNSEDQIDSYLRDTLGIQPATFRKPTSTEIRDSHFERAASWLLFVIASVSIPLALALTWIWLGGRSRRGQ